MLKIMFFLSFALLGCKSVLDEAPITTLWIIDVQHEVCSERRITDKQTLSSVWVKDHPLYVCDGNVALSMQEFLNLRTYIRKQK